MTLDELRQRPTLTVSEAAEVLGIGRRLCYAAIARGDLPVVRIGDKRLVVPTQALLRLLEDSGR